MRKTYHMSSATCGKTYHMRAHNEGVVTPRKRETETGDGGEAGWCEESGVQRTRAPP